MFEWLKSVVSCMLLWICLGPFQAGGESLKKAVFVIVDGIPADVLETTDTPYIDEIAGVGAYARAYVGGEVGGATESPTISAVGYQSLLTGTWANKHNVWDNKVSDPDYTYWDIFRIAKHHDPSLRTAVFSTWEDNRTKLIGDGIEAAGGAKLDHFVDGFENDKARFPHDRASNYIREIDTLVAARAATYIRQEGPDLTWVYLQYTDDVGHRYGDGAEQQAALQLTDGLVGQIWAAVQERQTRLGEDWLVVITTDHGRDAKNGKGHGGQSERERTTWIATNGARLADHFGESTAIVDIVPSIAAHMGLVIPPEIQDQLDGRSFIAPSNSP